MNETEYGDDGYFIKTALMKEQGKNKGTTGDYTPEQTDEIGSELETGSQANAAIEQQGDDAAAGIPRDTDAAKHEKQTDEPADDNRELTGAP